MLTDTERQYQAKLARILQSQKRAAKNREVVRSGDVPCYLSSMTEDKKADMGFYAADKEKLYMRQRALKERIKQAQRDRDGIKIIIVHNR